MKAIQTVLVVDDQPEILENLELILAAAGYRVALAADGIAALTALQAAPVDLILADIAMPRMNGYELYERVREDPAWVDIPFVLLTARAMDSDVRYGKGLGVDDYLTKPIEPEDVLAAVRGKLRRAQQLAQARGAGRAVGRLGQPLACGPLQVDADQHRAWMAGAEVVLSAREFALLECLVRRRGEVITPEDLVRATHGLDTDRGDAGALLRPLVRTLRRKLGYAAGEMGCIENVRGVGYRLVG
jgi:DNA-binding response OmpR family regulator